MSCERTLRALMLAAAAPLVLGCAKASAPAPSPHPDADEAPRLLTRGNYPDLSISAPNAAGRPSARIRLEVLDDESGRADLKTLKLTGLGAPENRSAIEQWLQTSLFRPAMRSGRPVPGVFKASFEVRVEVRRY